MISLISLFPYFLQEPRHLVDSPVLVKIRTPDSVTFVVISFDKLGMVCHTIAHSSNPSLDVHSETSGGTVSKESLHDSAATDSCPTSALLVCFQLWWIARARDN